MAVSSVCNRIRKYFADANKTSMDKHLQKQQQQQPAGNGCDDRQRSRQSRRQPSNVASAGKNTNNNCSGKSSSSRTWYLSLIKGPDPTNKPAEADMISAVEFNEDGDLFATGDKSGRIVVFKRTVKPKHCDSSQPGNTEDWWEDNEKESNSHRDSEVQDTSLQDESCCRKNRDMYEPYVSFVSHEPEFDYLKSLEIEEKINCIRFLSSRQPSNMLLSTNDKTIKLWKLRERSCCWEGTNVGKRSESQTSNCDGHINHHQQQVTHDQQVSADELEAGWSDCSSDLSLPRQVPLRSPVVEAWGKAIFKNGHAYHINSLSLSSDGETFISADDLRINLWHLDVQSQLFNIVDMKPASMEDLSEVITSASCHPIACNLLAYSSSKGTIRLCDLRSSALCDKSFKMFETLDESAARNFFSEIISSVSDLKFSHCGQYLLTRDYLTLKVWDLRNGDTPAEIYPVHSHLKTRLCHLYETDCIFDKFSCSWSGDDNGIITGSYGNLFTTVNRASKETQIFEASVDNALPGRGKLTPKSLLNLTQQQQGNGGGGKMNDTFFDQLDCSKRTLHCAWSPMNDSLAVATGGNLFFYSCDPGQAMGALAHRQMMCLLQSENVGSNLDDREDEQQPPQEEPALPATIILQESEAEQASSASQRTDDVDMDSDL